MIHSIDELEKFVEGLDKEMFVLLYGDYRTCYIDGYGCQVNGYYVSLETFSTEGYHVRFAIFDDDIEKLLGEYQHGGYREAQCPSCGTVVFGDVTIEDHGVCYDCHHEILNGERCIICYEPDHTFLECEERPSSEQLRRPTSRLG